MGRGGVGGTVSLVEGREGVSGEVGQEGRRRLGFSGEGRGRGAMGEGAW